MIAGNCVVGVHDGGARGVVAKFTWIKLLDIRVSLPKKFDVISLTVKFPDEE